MGRLLLSNHQLMDQILNDKGALGATTRASVYQAVNKFKQWPLEMAFQNHRGGIQICPSIIARNIATLIAADLHPLGGPEIWSGNPISTTLTLSIPITTDEDGCPTPTQPYTRVNRILRKLSPLWEHNIVTWEQIARLSPNKRPCLLSDEEILWANPHLRNKIPKILQKVIIYLRRLLQTDFPDHLLSLTLTLSKPNPQSTFLAARWLGLLASTLATLSPGPTPLQLLASIKQPDITTCLKKRQNVQGGPNTLYALQDNPYTSLLKNAPSATDHPPKHPSIPLQPAAHAHTKRPPLPTIH